jgi:hypothetical protein
MAPAARRQEPHARLTILLDLQLLWMRDAGLTNKQTLAYIPPPVSIFLKPYGECKLITIAEDVPVTLGFVLCRVSQL